MKNSTYQQMVEERPSSPGHLFDLKGRIACVTGASSGLGNHAANVLIAAGAKVVTIARRADIIEKWAHKAGPDGAAIAADLSQLKALEKIADDISKPFGPPDILVNAAGINTRQIADEVTAENWQKTLDLNLSTPFFLARSMVPAMKEKGWGRIINFASLQSFRAFKAGIAYGASKGGITQLTRAMAQEWSSFGINSNAIGPGFFQTELTAPVFADPKLSKQNAMQTCIGRNGQLDDLNGPLLFFSSPASNYVTGQVLMVDGGYTAK